MPRIKFSDAFEPGFSQNIQQIEKDILSLLEAYKKVARQAREFNKAVKSAKTFKDLQDQASKAAKSTKTLTDEERKLRKVQKQLNFELSDAGKKFAVLNERKKQAAKRNRELAVSQDKARKSTNTWTKALGSFAFKFNALGNIAANVASFITRSVRNAIRGAFTTIADFDQAMADVGAITQATGEEFEKLRNSAKELGASTRFTATEVAGLQKEYAKLGFTTQEILNAQEATLNLAAATKTDLARAAEVAGITVRQFGLNADQTTRVTDVMTKSFISSALDIEKFTEAMKFVGPAAKASGLSLEEATAYLGQLADAGISGSNAGTALRQILLATADQAGTFAQKIERAAEKGLDLAGASEEVQKRASTALLVLADGTGTIDDFTRSLEDAGGTAKQIADQQLDTLRGQLVLLRSAWDGLVTTIGDTEGAIEGTKGTISDISKAIQLLTRTIERSREKDSAYRKGQKLLRKEFLSNIPVIGQVFSLFKRGSQIVDTLTKRNEALAESQEDVNDAYQRGARDGDAWAKVFEDIGKIPKEAELNLNALQGQLSALRDKRDEVSLSEVQQLNDEIALLEDKIKLYKNIQTEVLPKILQVNKALADADPVNIFEGIGEDIELGDEFWEEWFSGFDPVAQDSLREQKEYFDQVIELEEAAQKRKDQIRKDEEKKRRESLERTLYLTGQAIDAISSITTAAFNKRITELDAEVDAAGDNADAIERIEKRQAEERRQIQLKQTYVNIAAGIARAFTDHAWPYSLIPAAAVASAGAIQIADINAQHFEKGTMFSPEGPAYVGEKGSELRIDPSGKISLTPDSESLTYLKRGTQIVPADITNQLMKYAAIATGLGPSAKDDTILKLMNEMEEIKHAIKSKPVMGNTITPAGIMTATQRGNTTSKKIKRYFM